jgi:hypothetical protein
MFSASCDAMFPAVYFDNLRVPDKQFLGKSTEQRVTPFLLFEYD